MSSENDDPSLDGDDETLNALLRASLATGDPEPEVARPPDDVIDNYLLGQASDEERELVLHAMAASRSFRTEMLARFEDLEQLGSPEARAAFHAEPEQDSPKEERPGFPERFRAALKTLFWQPLPAYAMLLVSVAFIGYLATTTSGPVVLPDLVIESPPPTSTTIPPPTISDVDGLPIVPPSNNMSVPDALRGSVALPPFTITVPPRATRVPVTIQLPAGGTCDDNCDRVVYRVRILDGAADVLGERVDVPGSDMIRGPEQSGYIQLLLPTAPFEREHAYRLVVESVETTPGASPHPVVDRGIWFSR